MNSYRIALTNTLTRFTVRMIYIVALILIVYKGIYVIMTNGLGGLEFIYFQLIPEIHYIGYPYSFVIFGTYLAILNYKFGLLSIPIFSLTYVMWEMGAMGLSIIYTSPNYYVFFGVLAIALIGSIFINKYMTIRISYPFMIFYLVTIHTALANGYYAEIINECAVCAMMLKALAKRKNEV